MLSLFICAHSLLLDFVAVHELALLTFRGLYSMPMPMPYPNQPTMTMFSQANLFPPNTISAAIPANAVQPPEDSRPRLPLDGPVIAGLIYSPEGGRPRMPNDDNLIPGFNGLSLSGEMSNRYPASGETSNRYPAYNPAQEEEGDVNH